MTKQGKVYLIGAGPGDPGLLSIKAMECLQTADAVVYDRLADPRILAYAKDDAEMVYVGKASANHTMRQPDINKLLVKLAAEGKTVARLKGGDPFVFGRGGEEAIELLEAGLPFEFVPGVTSAIAVAEYAGIPVTHRHVATSFAVITGHLTYKEKDRILRGKKLDNGKYEYESHVDYWMPFNGGIGLHDASWRSKFGGTIYQTSGSHGCVNLPPASAATLYDLLYKGIPVICTP